MGVILMVFTEGPVAPGEGMAFGGPYPGFTAPSQPGESDKKALVETHLKVFKEQVEAAQEFSPTLINSHSLKDNFTDEMATEFFKEALAWQEEKGYKVFHETHRKRFLHSPWVGRDFVPKFHHTHCRVGYDHGPQVPDPRLGQWLEYMEGHERWWDAIWRAAAERGDEEVTMTPEHGPPNYQVCDPRTEKPLADIWDVNHWVALRRQERFAEMFGAENTSKLIPSKTQGPEPVTNPGDSVIKGLENVGFS